MSSKSGTLTNSLEKLMRYLLAFLFCAALSAQAKAEPEDVVIGAGATAAVVATAAAASTPAVVAHSSGMAIMYSGAGYVAGTIGTAAGVVALLPAIAIGGAVIATGAAVYKYSDELGAMYEEHFGDAPSCDRTFAYSCSP